MAEKGDAKEYQVALIGFKVVRDSHAIVFEHIQARNEEERRGEIDRKGDGDVSSNECPAANPRRDPATPRG